MIKNSLWKRMVFGYIIIALFMLAMSFYLIFSLNSFNNAIELITKVDVPSIQNAEKLLDNLLEQVKNAKKYIITKDKAFLDLFNKKRVEFLDRLKTIEETITDEENEIVVIQIKEFYNKYITMISKEFILTNYKEIVPHNASYEDEKKEMLEQLTGSIDRIIITQQTSLIKKIGLFQETVRASTKISFSIILFAILFGALFSYFFTRSICFPLKTLTNATDRIASGDLDYRIEVTSRDEIGTLGIAFNQMCNKLKELDQMKSEFISNISHNLKTPLTAIREANELMLDKIAGEISEPQFKLLNITKESTLRLIMMINDLLDISRVESGLMRYNFQHSNIHEIIHRSIDDIRFLAEGKNIQILYTSEASIPEIPLDRDKIAQVMENIFSNAIKFTPSGGIITVKVNEVDPPNVFHNSDDQNQLNTIRSFIQVSMSDTGIGIPSEYHKKIFDKFQRVVNRGKGGIKGTGLGLYIAKRIVHDHGGDIWVENNTGNGSTFHFTLPLRYDYTLTS